jgi:hypothetical protein
MARRTEILSMRIDPKTKFLIEYLCRVNGWNISTAVETAIEIHAKRLEAEGKIPPLEPGLHLT